jgi:hypothetical protein
MPQANSRNTLIRSRRAVLAGAAAVPLASSLAALPATAAAAPPSIATTVVDPIFAHLERLQATWVELDVVVGEYSDLQQLLPPEKRESENRGGELTINPGDDPRWIDNQRRYRDVNDAIDDRSRELLDVRPTTVAGVVALLRYAQDQLNKGDMLVDELADELYGHVANALEAMAAS